MAARRQIFAQFHMQTFRAALVLHMHSRSVWAWGWACGQGHRTVVCARRCFPPPNGAVASWLRDGSWGNGAEFLAWSGGGVWLVLLGQAMGWQWSTVFVVAVSGIALSPQARGHGAGDCVHHVGSLCARLTSTLSVLRFNN